MAAAVVACRLAWPGKPGDDKSERVGRNSEAYCAVAFAAADYAALSRVTGLLTNAVC